MRSLYLTVIFNINNHIKYIEFLENEIEITYQDNSRKRFYYNKIGAKEDIEFVNKISHKMDKILKVDQDFWESETNENSYESETNQNSYESEANQNLNKSEASLNSNESKSNHPSK
ncbi:2266_t:CDS:1, partial [Scutellospora calospora]